MCSGECGKLGRAGPVLSLPVRCSVPWRSFHIQRLVSGPCLEVTGRWVAVAIETVPTWRTGYTRLSRDTRTSPLPVSTVSTITRFAWFTFVYKSHLRLLVAAFKTDFSWLDWKAELTRKSRGSRLTFGSSYSGPSAASVSNFTYNADKVTKILAPNRQHSKHMMVPFITFVSLFSQRSWRPFQTWKPSCSSMPRKAAVAWGPRRTRRSWFSR